MGIASIVIVCRCDNIRSVGTCESSVAQVQVCNVLQIKMVKLFCKIPIKIPDYFSFIFILFSFQYQFQPYKIKNAQMVCLGFEPWAAGSQTQLWRPPYPGPIFLFHPQCEKLDVSGFRVRALSSSRLSHFTLEQLFNSCLVMKAKHE